MKQPDRFARMVEKATAIPGSFCYKILDHDTVEMLLRAEHKAVVRLVKMQTILAGNMLDRGVLLAALARRAK